MRGGGGSETKLPRVDPMIAYDSPSSCFLTIILRSWSRVLTGGPHISALKIASHVLVLEVVPHYTYPGIVRGPALVRVLSSGKAHRALMRNLDLWN